MALELPGYVNISGNDDVPQWVSSEEAARLQLTQQLPQKLANPSYVMTPQEFQAWFGRAPTSQQELLSQSSGLRAQLSQDMAASSGGLEDLGVMLAAGGAMGGMAAGAAGAGGLGGVDAAWGVNAAGEGLAAGASIPELGMVANQATAGTALAGGISPSMLSGGAGALTLESLGAGGAFDMGGSAGVFDSAGNPLYTSPAGVGSTGTQSALQKILSGSGTASDYASLLGSAAPGLLQALGNYQSGNALEDLASQQKSQFDQFQAMGAPYRERLAGLYANPSGFLSSPEVQVPVQQGTDALARSLSAKVGNPIGNMTALGDLQNYSANQLFGRLGQEKDRLAGFGGLTAYNNAAANAPLQTQLAQLGIGADAGMWGGLGRAVGDVFNPAPQQMTLESFLKQMQGSNIFQYGGDGINGRTF